MPYLLLGAGIGAFIHGFMPQELIGLVLTEKGMSVGTVLALVIGGAGASIPELTLLSAIFEKKLLTAFVITIFSIAVAAGYMANLLMT